MGAFNAPFRFLSLGLPLVLLAGCDLATDAGPKDPPSSGWENTTDLTSPYGGYSMTDEAPGFGDPEMVAVEAIESPSQFIAAGDTLPSDSTYVVRIVWGQLRGNRNAQTEIDWTGSVRTSAGRLALRRTIAFEFPGDHIVRPRTDPLAIEFVSHTLPHFDGLLLLAHTNAPVEDPASGQVTLTFTTAPLTHTWTLAELVGDGVMVPVDDAGNAVAVQAMPLRPRDCPRGFARGAWVEGDNARGVLRGMWIAADGQPIGALRGHFGVTDAGQHIWFAKIITPAGRIIGLARGEWMPSDDPNLPGGSFQGHFAGPAGRGGGEIQGHYVPGRIGDDNATGFFEARWLRECPGGFDPEHGPGGPR